VDIVFLAMTLMAGGYCFAGMNENGEWVRPQLEGTQWKNLYYQSVAFSTEEYIRIGDVVRVEGRYETNLRHPAHVEDYIVRRFDKVGNLGQRELIAFLDAHSEGSVALDATLSRSGRSLCMVQVESFEVVYKEEGDPRRTRIAFNLPGIPTTYINTTKKPGYPCTCLRWRAIQDQDVQIPSEVKKIFIGVGLAREFTGADGQLVPAAPMVISLITDPAMPGEIDYDNP